MQPSTVVETLKEQLRQAAGELSVESLEELTRFIDHLKYRKQLLKTPRRVVVLEGLWKDLPFDITHDDVRALRQQVTEQVA